MGKELSVEDLKIKQHQEFKGDFPGGQMVKNPSANAGDTGLIPDQSRAHKPQLLKPPSPRACAPQQEKPPQWGARVPWLKSSPHLPQLEKAECSNKDPMQPINK